MHQFLVKSKTEILQWLKDTLQYTHFKAIKDILLLQFKQIIVKIRIKDDLLDKLRKFCKTYMKYYRFFENFDKILRKF